MAKPVTMPQLGESITEGTITRWLKSEGDEVEIDEPLAEVDTDKVNAELPSPVAGKIEKFLVSEGSTVDVGTEIALVTDESDSPAADAPPQENVAADAPTEEFPASGTEAQPAAKGTEGQRATVSADSDGNGRMDDLNGDKRVNKADATVLAKVFERIEQQYPDLAGGVAVYKATRAHGPFVHVDVRGERARWAST